MSLNVILLIAGILGLIYVFFSTKKRGCGPKSDKDNKDPKDQGGCCGHKH